MVKIQQLKILSQVALFHTGISMDERNFSDAKSFKPERFLHNDIDDNNKVKFRSSERVVFFGVGKRRCAGEVLARAEMYLFFVAVFQSFKFEAADDFEPAPPVAGLIYYPPQFSAKIEARKLNPKYRMIDLEGNKCTTRQTSAECTLKYTKNSL